MSIKLIKEKNLDSIVDIIIPSAGIGKRIKSRGPVSLVELKRGVTLINHQIKMFKAMFPLCNIILVSGFEADKVFDKTPEDIVKIENERYIETSVVRSIGLGLRASTSDKAIVCYGDLAFNKKMLEHIDLNSNSILITKNSMVNSATEVMIANNNLTRLGYELGEIKWTQVAYFHGKVLTAYKKECWSNNNYNKLGFEIINKMLDSGQKISAIDVKDSNVIDIDSIQDIFKAKQLI